MANVTSEVASEVVPLFANVDIMFKSIIALFGVGIVVAIAFAIYQLFNN